MILLNVTPHPRHRALVRLLRVLDAASTDWVPLKEAIREADVSRRHAYRVLAEGASVIERAHGTSPDGRPITLIRLRPNAQVPELLRARVNAGRSSADVTVA